MGKRYIDCSARELAAYHKKELLQSIADSEGRVLAAETIGTVTPMLVNITNAEFVTSLGADIIMLNIFDVDHPVINGLPEVAPEDTIHEVKRLTGRMVAINLEPAAVRNDGEKSVWSLTEGRRATVENAKKAADIRGDVTEIGWGNQIRSYVLQPYTMVKDHRTNEETGNADSVLDGKIDIFINAYLKYVAQKGVK